MIKVERNAVPPASLAIEKGKVSGQYNQPDVVKRLFDDFHGKCYICEMDNLQSIQIEHLLPHNGGKDVERKFDWNNLFLSCPHCNLVKNQKKYENNVVDCCRVDPETIIDQELCEGSVRTKPLIDSDEARTTALLVYECFELRNTAIRTYESQVRVKALKQTMIVLNKELYKYKKTGSKKSFNALRGMLNRQHKFAGFTRTYLRKNIEKYPELAQFVTI